MRLKKASTPTSEEPAGNIESLVTGKTMTAWSSRAKIVSPKM